MRKRIYSQKIKGKKRHILVGTLGLPLHAIVRPADSQDRDGGFLVMATLFRMFPFLKKLVADGGYQGPKFNQAFAQSTASCKFLLSIAAPVPPVAPIGASH